MTNTIAEETFTVINGKLLDAAGNKVRPIIGHPGHLKALHLAEAKSNGAIVDDISISTSVTVSASFHCPTCDAPHEVENTQDWEIDDFWNDSDTHDALDGLTEACPHCKNKITLTRHNGDIIAMIKPSAEPTH